ncbi:MAG: hypothetical protein IJU87_08380 [Lachnospiraceae bacterium]|nr:hypothetical protein [Lachnospiraceae bacterium]
MAAIAGLPESEPNFKLSLLSSAAFRDIQIISYPDTVIVLRMNAPYAAFAFTNYQLAKSFSGFLKKLTKEQSKLALSVTPE